MSILPLPIKILAAIGRIYPFGRGTDAISHHPFVKKMLENMDSSINVKLRSGLEVNLNPHDYDGRIVLIFGLLEPVILSICKTMLRKGDCFLDIGANNGAIGLNLISTVGDTGAIHLFEPQPSLAINIKKCIDKSNVDNLKIHEVGLSDKDKVVKLYVIPDHSGAGSIVRQHSNAEVIKISVKDTQSYIRPLIGNRYFGAKVDVEGLEYVVVPLLLKETNFRFIIFESNTNEDKENIWNILKAYNPNIFGISFSWFIPYVYRINSKHDMYLYDDFIILPPINNGWGKSRVSIRDAAKYFEG